MSIVCSKKVFRGADHDLTFRLAEQLSADGRLQLPWLGFRLAEEIEESAFAKPETYAISRGSNWLATAGCSIYVRAASRRGGSTGIRLVEDIEEKPEISESKCRNVIRGDVWYLSTKSAVSGFSGRYYFRGNLGIRLVEEVEEEVNV